jgi:hypothetical protein
MSHLRVSSNGSPNAARNVTKHAVRPPPEALKHPPVRTLNQQSSKKVKST